MPCILITRSTDAGRAFAARLREALDDADIVESPVFAIRALDPDAVPVAASVIVTSANGALALGRFRIARDVPVWTVGERTAEIARGEGYDARMGGADAESLLSNVIADPPPEPILHLRGRETRGDVAMRLAAAGLRVGEALAYEQVDRPLSPAARAMLDGPEPVVVPLFSPRSAERLAAYGPFGAPLHVVAISAAVARAAQGLRAEEMTIAAAATGAEMLRATVNAARGGITP